MNLVRGRNALAGILALVLVALPGVGDAATGLVAAYSFDVDSA